MKKRKLKTQKKEQDKEELKKELKDKGLSSKRIEAVLGIYNSKGDLIKNVGDANIDALTNEFLKKEYGGKKSTKKKSIRG